MLLLSASVMHFTSSLRLWFLPCWCRVVQWHVLCCKSQSTSKHLETGAKWVNIEITCNMPFIHFWFIWILVNICYEAARSPPKSCNKNMQQRLAMLVLWNGQIDGHCFWSTRDQLHVRSFEASTKTVFRAGNLDRTVREELKRPSKKKGYRDDTHRIDSVTACNCQNQKGVWKYFAPPNIIYINHVKA